MFSGYEHLGVYDSKYVAGLDFAISTGEEVNLLGQVEGSKDHFLKASKDSWLEGVHSKWERYLYQEAFNWKNKEVPAEVEAWLITRRC